MEKLITASLIFCGALTALGSPIPVSGSGPFVCNPPDSGWSVSFFGTNGTDSVNVSNAGFFTIASCPINASTDLLSATGDGPGFGSASIDSVSTDFFKFSVGEGAGYLILYDSASFSNIIGQADLISSVTLADVETSPVFSGEIQISPTTPEPSTFALMLIGFSTLALLVRRSR